MLSDPAFIVSSDSDTGVLWGAVLELIVAFAIVGTGVVLFPVLRRQNEGVALGFVTSVSSKPASSPSGSSASSRS